MSKRFRDILKIWWAWGVTEFIRSIIALIAVNSDSKRLAYLYQILMPNDILGIIAILMLHVYRFQFSGQYCSGDLLLDDRDAPSGYLVHRGRFLLGLVISIWVGLLTFSCIMSALLTAASRRESGRGGRIAPLGQKDPENTKLVGSSQKAYDHEIQTIISACSAASCGHVKILQRFEHIGISLNEGDYDKRTPLHIAASSGQVDVIKYLLSIGVDVNVKDRWGSTPLNDAKNKDIQSLLINHGATRGTQCDYKPIRLQNLTDEEYRLYYAAFRNDVKNMQIMNLQGWKVNAYDYDGRTALGIAASEGHLEAVRYLAENGASLKHRDCRGNNALDDAIREKRTTVVNYLQSIMKEQK